MSIHMSRKMSNFDEVHSTRSQMYIMQTVDEAIANHIKMKKLKNQNHQMEEPVISFRTAAYNMLFTSWLNVLLAAVPVAILSYALNWSDIVTFIFSLIALAPLAERLGFITEQLAMHTNETIGGLLNATFGNATELIVSITALQKGLYRLIQLSLLGSILSNLLLVLGSAFLLGGYYHSTQNYNKVSSQVNSTLLIVSTMAICYPTILYQTGKCSKIGEIGLSRAASLTLFIIYLLYLYFQLFTHKHIYDENPFTVGDAMSEKSARQRATGDQKIVPIDSDYHLRNNNNTIPRVNTNNTNNTVATNKSAPEYKAEEGLAGIEGGGTANAQENEIHDVNNVGADDDEEGNIPGGADDDDDEEEDQLGFWNGLFWLGVMTAFIAVLSEAISSTIESAAKSAGISGIFLAAIILPIVGNAAEHAGAIMFAIKGKVDLTLGIAIGSSTQIALCVLPLMVLIGWMTGLDLDLNFGAYESATVLLTVIGVTFAIKDGESNWLLGITLLGAYIVIAAGFVVHDNDSLSS